MGHHLADSGATCIMMSQSRSWTTALLLQTFKELTLKVVKEFYNLAKAAQVRLEFSWRKANNELKHWAKAAKLCEVIEPAMKTMMLFNCFTFFTFD